uniref:Dynein 2 heavy chain 1 cytoplasmic ATPase lid domain-containing protein n=1 Tax=Glossina pallidipes TaxID=7398 RepID=A0A1A9ZUF3_GLOPL
MALLQKLASAILSQTEKLPQKFSLVSVVLHNRNDTYELNYKYRNECSQRNYLEMGSLFQPRWYISRHTTSFMGAMGIPGGSNFIFPRLYHHTFVVAVDSFEDSTIIKIFTAIGDWHFAKGYVEKVALLSRGLAEAMVSVYRSSMSVFLPTPAKSHYTFSLRDITRVFQGIVMVPPKRLNDPEKLGRLWAHEIYRVFYDRYSWAILVVAAVVVNWQIKGIIILLLLFFCPPGFNCCYIIEVLKSRKRQKQAPLPITI